ncbi:lysozyme [Acinetobacter sp. 1207_04]|uniref:lysozyme n=1 Tax=Acinetobacter sp. 1207_04 TaxID=2604449 RepID=UPI00405963C5
MKSILQLLEVFSDTFLGRKPRDVMHSSVTTASDSDRNIGIARDTMMISPKGIEMICRFEGLQLSAYDDSVGVWSIGFGTIVYPSGTRVRKGDICTLEQAKFYMSHDLKKFEHAVDQAVKVSIDQNQFDALVSLTYNIGAGAFRNSTLLKKLNVGDYHGASAQFDVWNKASGRVLQGLVNRRFVERTLFDKT